MTDSPADQIISLDRFTIGYQKGSALLSQLNLTVNRGEMVALIGRNGTGKSTLLKSMIGLLAPLEGVCMLDGKPFSEYTLLERARRVSFVSSQLTQLPSLTVGELVGLGRMPYTGWMGRITPEDRVLIQQALEEVQMDPFVERRLECLSDGERQRAMIARAFVQDTPLMVLDEPTAFLDIPNTYDLIRLLSRFRDSGRSIVYSTHDLETAMQCADKMWVIHEDKILEGAPEDLGLSGLFNELFSNSGISYDEQTGRFLFSGTQKGSVSLEGEREEPLIWTRNALERLGYSVEKGADRKINIESSPGGVSWILMKKGGSVRFENLYSLARFLIEE
ncbi:MAG: ABC transporter ATP-binding protein [Bacteroidales bacterium]|nr:ABC transporter ATP-binding protein [Bacteroidales bacterium]